MNKLELTGVRKTFGDTVALGDVNLNLREGEFLSLLGPSGCGKSTTLDLVAGFQHPDRGSIRVDGADVNGKSPRERQIGIVFQDYAIFSHLRVRDNLAFGLEARRVGRAERKRRVTRMAEQLGLEDILDRKGKTLNMSEMQRVALARVLIVEPELLLLDEPMSNLDAVVRESLRTELKQIQTTLNQTVLYVTHDQSEALSLSDRIAVMDQGELLQIGAPEDIYANPRTLFVAKFIGDPPMNIINAEVHAAEPTAAELECGITLDLGNHRLEPGTYHLGIRPHHVAFTRDTTADVFYGETVFAENFGYEWITHVDCLTCTVRVAAQQPGGDPGKSLGIRLDLAQAHLFDGKTGRSLGTYWRRGARLLARGNPESRQGIQ